MIDVEVVQMSEGIVITVRVGDPEAEAQVEVALHPAVVRAEDLQVLGTIKAFSKHNNVFKNTAHSTTVIHR